MRRKKIIALAFVLAVAAAILFTANAPARPSHRQSTIQMRVLRLERWRADICAFFRNAPTAQMQDLALKSWFDRVAASC